MSSPILAKLADAEERLRVKIPSGVTDFIAALEDWECIFGGNEDEKWYFDTITDCGSEEEKNFIIDRSLDLRSVWGLGGVVFAGNGLGNLLLPLPEDGSKKLSSTNYVLLHEEVEIKIFVPSLQKAFTNGPEDYFAGIGVEKT